MDLHDYDRFEVDDLAEMLALLRESVSCRALCSVRASGRPESYLSPLRGIGDEGALMLDAPRVPVIERALAPGATASIDLRLPVTRVRFDAPVAGVEGSGRHGAQLRLSTPQRMLRLQRRDTVRVRVPDSMPVLLTLDPADPSLVAIPMIDLQVIGGSVSVTGVRGRLEAGRVFDRARITLPDGDERPVSVRIAHAAVLRRSMDGSDMRLGVQFVNPRDGFETAIARAVGTIARAPVRMRQA